MLRQAFGIAAYLASIASVASTAAWINNWGNAFPALASIFPRSIDGEPAIDLATSGTAAKAFFNVGLMGLLALQHNIMARQTTKKAMRKAGVPFPWERSVFAASASAALGAILYLWQPMPWTVWQVRPPYDKAVWALSALGILVFFGSTGAWDHTELFGLK
ncbi:hypothetical protein Agub_g9825, partial [Astrephomene gubernaculifera]